MKSQSDRQDHKGIRSSVAMVFAVIVLCACSPSVLAQWTTPDANQNINNTNTGNVGIGTSSPGTSLDVAGNIINVGSEIGTKNRANNTTKIARIAMPPYTTANMRFALLGGATISNANIVALGGEVGGMAAATQIDFFTAATTNVDTGTLRMTINGSGNIGIGTSSPASLLNIVGTNAALTFGTAGAADSSTFTIDVADSGSLTNGQNGRNLVIKAGNSENAAGRIGGDLFLNPGAPTSPATTYGKVLLATAGGFVGIGTTTPNAAYKLDVQGGSINSSGGLCIAGDCKTAWSQVGGSGSQWTTNGSNIYFNTGNVGIGTTSPASKLFVGSGTPAVQTLPGLNVALGSASYVSASNGTENMFMGADGSGYGILGTLSNHGVGFRTGNVERMRIDTAGNVGLGTGAPTEKLEVNGNIKLTGTGNITASGTIEGGNIKAKYQDVAEWVDSSQELPAGTVVVLDSNRSNQVTAATQAYDSRVAGVISLMPGITLGEHGEGRVLVATTGRVKVKVDVSNGPIQIGDLLVTSDREGFAMKSVPVEFGGVRLHRPGTLIGKALEPLVKGTGEILVLLSLQ